MCWHWRVVRIDLTDKEGYTDTEKLTIYIDESIDKRRATQVFFHELKHVLDFCEGVPDLNEDHERTDRFGSMMAQVILSSKGKVC